MVLVFCFQPRHLIFLCHRVWRLFVVYILVYVYICQYVCVQQNIEGIVVYIFSNSAFKKNHTKSAITYRSDISTTCIIKCPDLICIEKLILCGKKNKGMRAF